MTIITLLTYIAIVAAVLTAVIRAIQPENIRSYLMTYFQNFCGSLFIFSGLVKAVDPLGTAYKMEQYFSQFEVTFDGTWFSFLAPMFPFFSNYSVTFSVVMILFEIVLGIMLILGSKPKFTAWAFFSLVVFFTILTGFTFLTGYVPQEANFFDFGAWAAFNENNMRVTDCGCFGDFIKLKPRTSFFKDIFLLVPSIYFVWRYSDMHDLFTAKVRTIILSVSTAALLGLSLYSFMIDLPLFDFRPFKEGKNIRASKEEQIKKVSEAPIIFIYKNTATGEEKQFDMNNLPGAGWEFVDRIQEDVETDKIYDFAVEGDAISETTYLYYDDGSGEEPIELSPEDTLNGMVEEGWTLVDSKVEKTTAKTDISNQILANPNYHFMIVCNDWKDINKNAFATKIAEMHKAAEAAGVEFYAVVGKAGPEDIEQLKKTYNVNFPFYTADDILLKTIVRSNPGIVLWKDGTIIKKWHHRQVPTFDKIKAAYLK